MWILGHLMQVLISSYFFALSFLRNLMLNCFITNQIWTNYFSLIRERKIYTVFEK